MKEWKRRMRKERRGRDPDVSGGIARMFSHAATGLPAAATIPGPRDYRPGPEQQVMKHSKTRKWK